MEFKDKILRQANKISFYCNFAVYLRCELTSDGFGFICGCRDNAFWWGKPPLFCLRSVSCTKSAVVGVVRVTLLGFSFDYMACVHEYFQSPHRIRFDSNSLEMGLPSEMPTSELPTSRQIWGRHFYNNPSSEMPTLVNSYITIFSKVNAQQL